MSTTHRSSGASPRIAHSARAQPAPPAAAMPKALKPAPTYMLAHSGAAPRMKLPSGVKLSGPLIIWRTPAVSSAGTRAMACVEVLGEMIPVVVEELELEGARNVAGGPRDGVGLVAAHDEAADFFLEVGAAVGIADGGRVGREAFDLFGDDVLVLDGLQRHGDAGHGADLARPHAAAIDDGLAVAMRPSVGEDGDDAVAFHLEAGDADAFDDAWRRACARPWRGTA